MLFSDPARLTTSEILNWHGLCLDGINAQRAGALQCLRTGTAFPKQLEDRLGIGLTENDIEQYCEDSCLEVDISTVLVLTASAEARIRLDFDRRQQSATNSQDFLSGRLRYLAQEFTAQWSVPLYDNGILDAWKQFIGKLQYPNQQGRDRLLGRIGAFRNILLFRHWIAHGRYWKHVRGPSSFPPSEVARTIDQLYKALEDASSHGQVIRFT